MNNEILNEWLQPSQHARLRAIDHPALQEIRTKLPMMATSDIITLLANPDVFFETLEEGSLSRDKDLEKLAAAGVILLRDEIDARIPPRQGSAGK